jgi:hypothetical protein
MDGILGVMPVLQASVHRPSSFQSKPSALVLASKSTGIDAPAMLAIGFC